MTRFFVILLVAALSAISAYAINIPGKGLWSESRVAYTVLSSWHH